MSLLVELCNIAEDNRLDEAFTLAKAADKVGLSADEAHKWSNKWKKFARKSDGVNSASAFASFKDGELHVVVNGKKQGVSAEKKAELAKVFKLIRLIYLSNSKVQENWFEKLHKALDLPAMPRGGSGREGHKARLDKMEPVELLTKIKKDIADERGHTDFGVDDVKGHAERTAARLGHTDKSVYWNKIKHIATPGSSFTATRRKAVGEAAKAPTPDVVVHVADSDATGNTDWNDDDRQSMVKPAIDRAVPKFDAFIVTDNADSRHGDTFISVIAKALKSNGYKSVGHVDDGRVADIGQPNVKFVYKTHGDTVGYGQLWAKSKTIDWAKAKVKHVNVSAA